MHLVSIVVWLIELLWALFSRENTTAVLFLDGIDLLAGVRWLCMSHDSAVPRCPRNRPVERVFYLLAFLLAC